MYYVYVLHSEGKNKKYIGFTRNLKRRVKEHKSGNGEFTKTITDWKLVYYESFMNKADAKEEEKFLKSGKGRERLKCLLKNYMEDWLSG